MSYQVGQACYGTAQEAAQASASAQVGNVVQHGATAYIVNVTSVTETAIEYSLQPVGGGSPVVTVSPYTAQPCNMLQASDGLTVGWAMLAVWISTYAVLFIAKAVRGETVGDYGNA